MGYILVLALYLFLIGIALGSSALSLAVGLFASFFVGIFSAVKNCILGIHRSISNMFMKVILYITVGIVVLGIVAFVGFFIVMIVLSFI